MPIIETRKIKQSIVRSKDLLRNNIPIPLDEETVNIVNSYPYSLGIMDNSKSYKPGFTEQIPYFGTSKRELLVNVCKDLKNLGIPFRLIYLNYEVSLGENEYFVKIFYTPPNEKLPFGDFHFIRQDRCTGKWFHKLGKLQPAILQSDPGYDGPEPGSEPSGFKVEFEEKITFVYEPVAYLAISEN